MNLVEPGIVIQLIFLIVYLLPVAIAIWAVVTLHRIRRTQLEMQTRLNTIEGLLKSR
jgi:hypothetical protein